jgi:hypothetical protein
MIGQREGTWQVSRALSADRRAVRMEVRDRSGRLRQLWRVLFFGTHLAYQDLLRLRASPDSGWFTLTDFSKFHLELTA